MKPARKQPFINDPCSLNRFTFSAGSAFFGLEDWTNQILAISCGSDNVKVGENSHGS